MRFSARILFAFLLFTLLSIFATTKTFAQITPVSTNAATNSYAVPQTDPDVPKNLHTWTQNVMIETMSALVCQLAGIDPINPKQDCLGVNQKTGKIGFVKNGRGAIGLMGNALAMLYTPPIHTGDYFQNLASGFGVVKKVNAQTTGTGFQSLSPILGIWTAFRNIVYLLLVLAFVIIGLAIMLRVKIDPRTVMTVQNQIPKIIVGLLLVTFSFAISGFLVDVMYTSIYLTGNALSQTDPKIANTDIVKNVVQSTNPLEAADQISAGPGFANIAAVTSGAVGGYIKPVFDNPPGRIITGVVGFIIGSQVRKAAEAAASVGKSLFKAGISIFSFIGGTAVAGPVGGAAATAAITTTTDKIIDAVFAIGGGVAGLYFGKDAAGFVMSLIAFLIISIAMLFALFRLWFALIGAYIFLLLDVVTAPFWIFAGLIPGSPVSFGLWLRDIVSNLAAFPVAIVMFLLGRVFVDAFGTHQILGEFVPPLLGNPSSTDAIGSLIGLGFILLTPNVVHMTKAALKAPKFDTTPIKQAIGAGAGVPTRGVTNAMGAYATSKYDITGKETPEGRAGRLFQRFFR